MISGEAESIGNTQKMYIKYNMNKNIIIRVRVHYLFNLNKIFILFVNK